MTDLLTTAASKYTEAYHTYDVAGNVWEYTEEIAAGIGAHVARGGSCMNNPDGTSPPGSACVRAGDGWDENLSFNLGFRVVLYIK